MDGTQRRPGPVASADLSRAPFYWRTFVAMPGRYTYMQWDAAFATETAAMLIEAPQLGWSASVLP